MAKLAVFPTTKAAVVALVTAGATLCGAGLVPHAATMVTTPAAASIGAR